MAAADLRFESSFEGDRLRFFVTLLSLRGPLVDNSQCMSHRLRQRPIVQLQRVADLDAKPLVIVYRLPTMVSVVYLKDGSAPIKVRVKLQEYLVQPAVHQRQVRFKLFGMASAIGQSKAVHQARHTCKGIA